MIATLFCISYIIATLYFIAAGIEEIFQEPKLKNLKACFILFFIWGMVSLIIFLSVLIKYT